VRLIQSMCARLPVRRAVGPAEDLRGVSVIERYVAPVTSSQVPKSGKPDVFVPARGELLSVAQLGLLDRGHD
jgi:hypothetical protein